MAYCGFFSKCLALNCVVIGSILHVVSKMFKFSTVLLYGSVLMVLIVVQSVLCCCSWTKGK